METGVMRKLSNAQRRVLDAMAAGHMTYGVAGFLCIDTSEKDAMVIRSSTLASLVIRGLIEQRFRHGYVITDAGRAAVEGTQTNA
jgi:hypothetical protein